MNARAQSRYLYTLLAPLMRTDQAQQLAQRCDTRLTAGAPGFDARQPRVGRAVERNPVIGVERNKQHRERVRALRLRLALAVKGRAWRGIGWRLLARHPARTVYAPLQRLQHLARILEIADPQEPRATAREAIGRIGSHGVVGDDHTLGRRRAALRSPPHRARRGSVVKVDQHVEAPASRSRRTRSCCGASWRPSLLL